MKRKDKIFVNRHTFDHSTVAAVSSANRETGIRGLGEEFFERLPVTAVPALGEVVGLAVGEASVIEDELCAVGLLEELESRDGVNAGGPTAGAPGLDDASAGDEFDLAAADVAPVNGECAARLGADFGGLGRLDHSRLHGGAELDHLIELLGVGESVVDPLARGFEDDFLVDGFASMGNFIGRRRSRRLRTAGGDECGAAESEGGENCGEPNGKISARANAGWHGTLLDLDERGGGARSFRQPEIQTLAEVYLRSAMLRTSLNAIPQTRVSVPLRRRAGRRDGSRLIGEFHAGGGR